MRSLILLITLLCLCQTALANVFRMGAGLRSLETVVVGDAGNVEDSTGHGSVGYDYRIGKYEVTVAQYVEFLNAKAKADPYALWESTMGDIVSAGVWGCNIQRSGSSGSYLYKIGSGSALDNANWGNRPVNHVSRWDACRFINWLCNGQGGGSTETGAYNMNGYTGNDYYRVTRNAQWTFALASEDEWYKAAYYRGGGPNAGYWTFPTQNDSPPTWGIYDPDPGNCANYYGLGYLVGAPYWTTNVGEFENTPGPYGTFDQGGNVWEWTDTGVYYGGSYCRGYGWMWRTMRYSYAPCYGYVDSGFRIVALVPEPASMVVLLAGAVSIALGARRRPLVSPPV